MTTKRLLNCGFTIIELLMVIALIGLLATISFGYLKTAQLKGFDAAAKNDLLSMRPEMELVYVENGSTGYTCTSPKLDMFLASLQEKTGTSTICNPGTDAWAVEIDLRTEGYFCIDSVGSASSAASSIGSGVTACQ